MSFTRQILIFIAIWALLIYIFLTKLNTTSSTESNEMIKLNEAFNYLERSNNLDKEVIDLLSADPICNLCYQQKMLIDYLIFLIPF